MNRPFAPRPPWLIGLLVTMFAMAAAPARAGGIVPVAQSDPRLQWIGEPFGAQRLGTRSAPYTLRLTNSDVLPLEMGPVTIESDANSGRAGEGAVAGFAATTDCPGAILLPGASCEVAVTFGPLRTGSVSAYLRVIHGGMSGQVGFALTGTGTMGLFMAGAFGEVLTFGDARSRGDLSHVDLDSPVLAMATTGTGQGYWLVQAGGEVHAFGDAPDLGSVSLSPERFVVSMSATPTGKGYWLAADDGTVFTFGDAENYGAANEHVPEDGFVIAMSGTPTGRGYWLLDTNGGVHAFGDAGFFGAPADAPMLFTATAIAPTPSGQGYWVIDGEGGIFAYGDANGFPSERSTTGESFDVEPNPYVAIEAAPIGQTIWYTKEQGGMRSQGGTGYEFDYPNAYGSSQLEAGSGVVDLAVDVRPFTPASDAGTVQVSGRSGPRAPQQPGLSSP